MKRQFAVLAIVLLVPATIALSTSALAQPLTRDPLPLPGANITGPIQMTIEPSEFLPANGTMTLSLAGMNDIDFKDTPPAGISVLITNESATVTNQPIEAPGVAPGSGNTVPTPASTPGDSGGSSDESSSGSDE